MKKLYIIALLSFFIGVQAKAELACLHEVPANLNQRNSNATSSEPTFLTNKAGIKACDKGYGWGFSKKTNVNVYATEYLTKDQVLKSKEIRRYGTFDNRDPLIRDYRNSGYDRGHMAPSGDMGDYDSQVKTFSSQNLVPQTRTLNSGKWNWIENQVRQMAIQYGSIYIVSGPYFQGRTKKIGENKLWVPYATWKAVYIPHLKQAGVYFCRNTSKPTCYIQTIDFFTKHTGIDPFPTLDESIKRTKASLPKLVKKLPKESK